MVMRGGGGEGSRQARLHLLAVGYSSRCIRCLPHHLIVDSLIAAAPQSIHTHNYIETADSQT